MLQELESFFKTLKNHREKSSVCFNVCISKIMCKPIKIGIHTYGMYASCWSLVWFQVWH